MTVEEIFGKVAAHLVKGMMAHDQLANYYHFLGLDGCKCCHEYHFLKETLNYRKIQKYYICKYNKLVNEERVEDPNIIPDSWHKYTRQEVDSSTKRNAVKTALEVWHNWEIETYKSYCTMYKELEEMGEYSAACTIMCLISDVEDEIKDIEKKKLKLSDVDYSLSYLNQRQSHLREKYHEKKKELLN